MAIRVDRSRVLLGAAALLAGTFLGYLAGVDPTLAILAAAAFGYVLITFADLAVGLCLFIPVSFLEVLSAGGVAVSVTKLMGVALALSWLALVATRGERKTDLFSAHPLVSYGLILLVAWSALSTVWADDSASALTVASRLFLNAILYVIVYTAVRDGRSARLAVAAFVAGAIGSALLGLIASPQVPGAPGRLESGILDPNELGAVLVGGAMLALGLAAMPRRGSSRFLLALSAAAFCLAALFLTASRGGLIALIVAMLSAIVFGGRWRWAAAVLAVFLACSGYFYFSALASQVTRQRIAEVTTGEAGQSEGRATIWKVGWRMFEANPVHGVGSGNFSQAALKYVVRPGEAPRSDRLVAGPAVAHNSYLEMFSELGLVGGGLFIGLVGFSVGCAVAAARRFQRSRDTQMEALSRGLVVAMIGVLAADFFISEEVSKQFWLLLALGPAFLGIARSSLILRGRSGAG